MFTRGGKPTSSAADAERQALFEKLAQRPETVCPFLGLAAERSEFEPQATDDHRCYAFGDPEPVSGEQQRNVCLQRGYANCPRYLRGVLVIPTDELEALRRPPQKVPPPPPSKPPVDAGDEGGRRRRLVVVLLLLLLLVGGGAGAWYFLAGPGAVATAPSPTPRISPSLAASPAATTPPSSGASGSPGATPPIAITGTNAFGTTGATTPIEGGLRLTPGTFGQVGAAWYPDPLPVSGGFTVEYGYRVGGLQLDGADGIAFVIQTAGPDALGGVGGQLGYGGLANSIALEADTFLNAWPGVGDPNANHVSLHTAGAGPNDADHARSLGSATAIPDLSDEAVHTIRITYVPGSWSVSIDGTEVLTVIVNLAEVLTLGPDGTAYVGFTASTGENAQENDLLAVSITLP